jgi:diaminohydroxyphosphoribosylaminopyrimidine deaminase/5-amino-6-(5-phosphoribosylamino)uracil reductase
LVGCVLVRDGGVVGEGFHERAGGPHAEVVALTAAGEKSKGATAYVTLEPCNHHGRTPPCAPALVKSGVACVVIGMPDPNPGVAGSGATFLREQGVDVTFAEDPTAFAEQNIEWRHLLESGLPFVRVKTALTLDGHPTLASGVRCTLTGQGARALTMRLRADSDAVMVGAATVAVDDPALTVRDAEGDAAQRQPKRVVLARTELPPAGARMFGDGLGRAMVLVPEEAGSDPELAEAAHVVDFPIAEGLRGALRALAAHDVVSLLVEAGPRMLSALWDEDLIDELVLLHAGGMAGEGAPALFVGESPGVTATLVRRFRAVEAGLAGSDAVTVWRRAGTVDEDE